jgi:hypothetical protein
VVAGGDLLQGIGTSTDASQLTINVGESAGWQTASLTDGLFPGDDRALAIAGGALTYTLDTTLNTSGYDITGVATYGGWVNWSRSQQKYTLAYATVGSPTNFITLAANVDSGYYTSDSPSYTAVWLTNNPASLLATNVKHLRFTFPAQLNSGAGYREFDVFGAASQIVQTNPQVVIYHDSFSRQGLLHGSTPDQGATPWVADAAWQLDGSRARVTASGRLALLPFQPCPNNIYTLSATIHCTNASPAYEWMSIGFANGFTTSGAWHTVNNPVGWSLLRYQSDANNQAQSFLGPGSAYAANVGAFAGQHTLTIVLDTRAAVATNWTFEFKIDGTTVLGPLPHGSGTPQISSVGMGNGAGVGLVQEFSLTSANDDAPYKITKAAADIRGVTPPMRGATNLILPEAPPGCLVSIKSSSIPAVVATNGTIVPPPTNTVVTLVLTVTQPGTGATADTIAIKLFVPAGQAQTPFVRYFDNFTMRRGSFIHWSSPPDGQGNPIVFSNGSRSTTIDQFTSSVNVPAVVNQIASLGFEYVILTDFHGYQTTLHPCAALDSWRGPGFTSARDLVGEFIVGLKAHGIPVYLFTHPLDGYDGYTAEQQVLVGWNDPSGGYKKWNNFVNDVHAELVERYGDDIAGIGFDSDFGMIDPVTFGKLDQPRLRQTILSRRPELSLTALAGPNQTGELGMKEVWRPSWLDPWGSRTETDYDSETWPAYRRITAIVQGYHWTTITPPSGGMARLTGTQMFRYSVMQAGVATEGPGVAWAATPYTDGTWENGVQQEFSVLNNLTQPLLESLEGVQPSSSYPRDEGVWLTTLPQGIVATRRPDNSVEYIHVLNPPGGKTLSLPLPADGKRFISASLLANGHAVQLATNASTVSLTIGAGDVWNTNDTVIKLMVDPTSVPASNFALHRPVSASSSHEYGPTWGPPTPWGRIRLVDGQTTAITPTNGWSAGNYGFSTTLSSNGFSTGLSSTNRPEWVIIDLEATNWVNRVRLTPRNDPGNVGEGYPVNFTIATSIDGASWTLATNLVSQTKPSTSRSFTFPTRAARHVRLYASQLRVNASGTFGLQLSEMEVFGLSGLSTLTIQKVPNGVALQWTNGALQSAEGLGGSFSDVNGAVSPFTNSATLLQQFYRLRF